MMHKAFGLLLTVALALSWVAPLCAAPMAASQDCCAGAKTPAPDHGQVPACCRVSESVPADVAVTVSTSSPVLLSADVSFAAPRQVRWVVPTRSVPAAPQAPPGSHSGLSPPASGL